LSDQCDDELNQAMLLSMVPSMFALSDSYNENVLLQFIKWFSMKLSTVKQCVPSSLTPVQMLVAMFRSMGLRARLVLVIEPMRLFDKKDSSIGTRSNNNKRVGKRKRQTGSSVSTSSPYFDLTDDDEEALATKKLKQSPSPHEPHQTDAICNNTDSTSSLYDTYNSWVEVMLPCNNKWMPVHLPSVSVNQCSAPERYLKKDIMYAIGFEHGFVIRDVTARYSSRWCVGYSKMRIDGKWLDSVLLRYCSSEDEFLKENNEIKRILLSYPLPSTSTHYKNHKLYVLKKNLLKHEAIYPEDCNVIGNFKGEPVYSRDNVHILHTREKWLTNGYIIRHGESPYKMVKGRKGNMTTPLFGQWQTELYKPPPVINGKIPKNEYGNIEIFTESMIPTGAVHLAISGISKVAHMLGIDCAPAVTGWKFNGGYSYPLIEGIVVAEEYKDVLMEAWEQQQQCVIEKDVHKQRQLVLNRWVTFTNGVLLQNRVKQRYADQ
jgi:xeroderma pigmentosum group C-complementing protein